MKEEMIEENKYPFPRVKKTGIPLLGQKAYCFCFRETSLVFSRFLQVQSDEEQSGEEQAG